MSTSRVPSLIDALVSQCTTALPTAVVVDGYGVVGSPGDFLMIGVDDPTADGPATSADVAQTPGPFGTQRPRDEEGVVACVAGSWNGNSDQKAARDAAYAMTTAVENLLRTSPNLGVPGVLWTGFGSSTQLQQQQNTSGAYAFVVFRIQFRARI